MFGARRLAKRSIIGTRVCAPWTDGRYYAGVIQATQNWPNGEEVYTVLFDDGKAKIVQDKDLIGPGFQGISSANLKQGQKIFLTYNGREVNGIVESHDSLTDDVYINVCLPEEENTDVVRKLEELRLIQSRKSARLLDQDTDYSRLADVHSEAKKRPVSHFIDVPFQKNERGPHHVIHNRRPYQDDEEEVMELDDEEKKEMMDDHLAAMVLTRLSCSPASPSFPVNIGHRSGTSPGGGSSYGSSGVWGMKGSPSNHSPPSQLSSSAPVGSNTLFGTSPIDEGIDLDETDQYLSDEATPRKKRASVRTVFKCTWPNCGQIYNTVPGVEQHVRIEHLGPREEVEDDDDDISDHEEEFYYTEIEMSVETITQTFASMNTSSPPSTSYMGGSLPDHDYQKKSIPILSPSSHHKTEAPQLGSSYPGTIANASYNMPRSSSWQSGGMAKITKSETIRPHPFASTVKNSPLHKKSRNEIKKCRKVYGMENRDMWCTQCKWKKACTRFRDMR